VRDRGRPRRGRRARARRDGRRARLGRRDARVGTRGRGGRQARRSGAPYVALAPDDDAALLAFGRELSWSKDANAQHEAVAVLDRYLARHPGDAAAILQRGRAHAWSGEITEGAADLRAYLATNPKDAEDVRLELATVLSWSKDAKEQRESIAMFDAYLAAHPGDREHRLQRARLLLWSGDYDRAETELDALGAVPRDALTDAIDLERARLLSQTGRKLAALTILDDLVARDAKNEDARAERERLLASFAGKLEFRASYFRDSSPIGIFSFVADAARPLSPRVAILASGGMFGLSSSPQGAPNGRLTERYDLGWRARPIDALEIEATGGARTYSDGIDARLGARSVARLELGRRLRASAFWQYDDVFLDLNQPATLNAGIRAHWLGANAELSLPVGIALSGQLGARLLTDDNRQLDANGTALVTIVGPLRIGATAQLMGYRSKTTIYWSPQRYAALLGLVRVSGEASSRLSYEVQALLGGASEHVDGAPDAGLALAYGGSAAFSWAPSEHVQLRVSGQFGRSQRTTTVEAPGATGGTDVVEQTMTYWWTTLGAGVAITF
jgi:hypothetical protein